MTRLFLPLLLAALWAASPVRAEPPQGLKTLGEGVVGEVVDGDTIVLTDGRRVRLSGVLAPRRAPPDNPTGAEPLAEASADALRTLVQGQTVALMAGGAETDRYGRTVAHLVRSSDGLWVQGALLRDGWVRMNTHPDNRSAVPEMRAAEAEARADPRGLWADPAFMARTPETLGDALGTFQVVQGRLRDVNRVGARVFLNFGPDWRTDFTAELAARDLKAFSAADLDPLALEGSVVEVRGWVEEENGPMIRVTHPEQVHRVRSR